MNFFNIAVVFNIVWSTQDFESIREVLVLENNFWGEFGEQIETDKGFLDSVFYELVGFDNILECTPCMPFNCYHDYKNKKFYHVLCQWGTDQSLSVEKHKIMKFIYTYCNMDHDNFSRGCQAKKYDYYCYKIFKKAENGSIEFESENSVTHLCHIKDLIQALFKYGYLSSEKTNSIKKKRIDTEFPDFKLLHFESLCECQKSFKSFVKFLKCLKLVSCHSNLDEESSTDNDFYSNKKNASQHNEENIENKSEENLEDASTESGPFLDNDLLSEPSIIEKMWNYKSDSSSSDEDNSNNFGTLIIRGQLWRKKGLINIEEESEIDVDSSSTEEDYTVENPNRRLKVFFLKKYLKKKFCNDYKDKKEGDERGLIIYRQIKLLFNRCCIELINLIMFDVIILPVKGAFTLIFYLDKFYELIKISIDSSIESGECYNFENDFALLWKYVEMFERSLSNFHLSIIGDAWKTFNVMEFFTTVIGKDITTNEDYEEVEKIICDYHNMMSTTLKDKKNRNPYREQNLINLMFKDDHTCRIIRMLEVTFTYFTEICDVKGYDSRRRALLLKRNEEFFLTIDKEDGVLFNIEKIRILDIYEIEIIVSEVKKSLRFKVKDYVNGYNEDDV